MKANKTTITEFKKAQELLIANENKNKLVVRICMTGCKAFGADEIRNTFLSEIKKHKLPELEIRETGCHGFCAKAPVLAIDPYNIFYQQVKPENVSQIIETTIKKGKVFENLTYFDTKSNKHIENSENVPFYKEQKKIVLRNCGFIDPTNINHFLIRGGYTAFIKVLTSMKSDEIIEQVKKSGLRGRGGAGFPTGKKWELAKNSSGKTKYLVCNGDEGDPGAFMDRAVLEGDPHSVLEGMLIAAWAIGAQVGYIYVRAEYPIAVRHIKLAINQAQELGLLGENIFGTGFNFNIHIKEGAGAFVFGEETALIASIEGKRGMPRPRPPFPAQKGIFGMPTNINNVETFANIAPIINNGGDWYAGIGTNTSKGTKVFSLAGKINNTGLVEVPMGITLRKIIFDIGGGITNNKEFKAVQMGGPSGGCVPKQHLDLSIDYESLASVGSIMGSGGMVVLDENTCMVDLARFFMHFCQDESCGKCTPCRIGTKRMLEILNRISEGDGKEEDISLLEEIGKTVKDTSLCGLGQTSPNPVLTTIRYFRDEYEAHIKDKKCPAGVCKKLINYSILADKCTGCTVCAKNCSANAISGEKKKSHTIDKSICTKCGTCFEVCKFKAVLIK